MNKTRIRIARGWKWGLGIFLAICLLLSSALFWLSHHWKPILSSKLKSAVAEGSDGLYKLDFNDIYVNLLTGYLSVDHPMLTADTAVYEQLKKVGKAPGKIFNISVNQLILEDTHPWKAWRHKVVNIGSIIIDHPSVNMIAGTTSDTLKVKDNRTLYQRISKTLRSIHVGKIFLTNADFKFTDKRDSKPAVTVLKGLSVRITDVLIDSASQDDKTRFYTARDIFVQLKNYDRFTPDGMYKLKLGELSASTQEGYVRLKNFRVLPLYPELKFSYKYPHQHDRYDMTVPEILLSGIDFSAYNDSGRIRASKLLVDRALVKVFLNRSLPPPPIDKWVNFPHVILRKLKINTLLDSVHIRRSTVYYSEFNPLSGRSGTIYFKGFDARLDNVTNDPISLRKNHHSRAALSALLLGKTKMRVFINFNLTDPAGAFTYSGYTQNLDLTDLNVVNRPMSLVEVKSGFVKRAEFNVSANRYGASGTLKLWYNDLKITLLKKDYQENAIRKSGLLSFIANAVLVKNDNPSGKDPLRIGQIKFDRPHWSSFFNLLWKGVFVGIKQTVGLGIIKEKDTQPSEDGRVEKAAKKAEKARQKQEKKEKKKLEKERKKKEKAHSR